MTDMSETREAALTSKAWPFEEARRLLKRYQKGAPEKGYVLFETGYGPSGLPHIGTFGEVARTTMVRRAFEEISDIPTRLICFSDDLDGMRKVPGNVPDAEAMQAHLQKPLTSVPDPFGTHDSFGAHNNAKLREFLDTFGFEYEFISATEFYGTGQFDEILLRAVEKYDEIMAVMLKSLREERRQTYSIFLPIHPETGRVMYVPMKEVNATDGTITFEDEDGTDITLPVTGGNVKLQWKPDFGARWAALGVDFEMYGKDHSTNTPIYDSICRILGQRAPEHFTYVIPKAVDEYHQQLRAYETQDIKARLNNPVWHIHGGDVPKSDMVVPYSMLLNLASVSSAEDKSQLWGFIQRYAPDATPEANPGMDAAAGHAVRYYNDFVKPHKVFRAPSDLEREAMQDLRDQLAAWDGGLDAEALQTMVFAVGKERFEPLRDWFTALYEVLLGASQGPRFGGFIALYGVDETIALIDEALAGKLITG